MNDSLAHQTAIVVPARLDSQRIPRKLLVEIAGKPLILWTAEQIAREVPEFGLWFAVDGDEIGEILKSSGFATVSTDPDLPSGTDRIAVANDTIGVKSVINVQADEPLVTRGQILSVAKTLSKSEADMATLACRFESLDDFRDSNQVKVVRDKEGFALYFSRSPIPHPRDDWQAVESEGFPAFRHIGIYAYSSEFLQAFREFAQGALEKIEKLELLRAMENGHRIAVGLTNEPSIGVDSIEDLNRVAPLLQASAINEA